MARYVALLRGINVGGAKKIRMADLKSTLEKGGLQSVTTYIQSGNVVFSSPQNRQDLEREIQTWLKKDFGFDVETIVLSEEMIRRILDRNPFREATLGEGERVYFTILRDEPEAKRIDELLSIKNDVDDLRYVEGTVYILCRKGYGTSQFSNNFVEKKLKITATTRNLETMGQLLALVEQVPMV